MNIEKKRVYILDDEQDMVDSFTEVLSTEFHVESDTDCLRSLKFLKDNRFDAIILDINMPMMNGFDVYREISKFIDMSSTAVMFLSSITSIQTKVAGLELGADDYIIKPVLSKELIARVKNRIRRLEQRPIKNYRHGKTTLNTDSQKVEFDGKVVDLTPTEYKILFFLWRSSDTIISKDKIAEGVWGTIEIGYHTIDTHISNLRKKIEDPALEIRVTKNQGVSLICRM
jgi:two-component system alkaline phosphatase synthesis response regulator PhoP